MAKLMPVTKTLGLTVLLCRLRENAAVGGDQGEADRQAEHGEGARRQTLCRSGRGDGQAQDEQRAHHLGRLGDGEGQDEEKHQPQQAHGHAARHGHLGVDRGEEQRAVDDRHDDDHGEADRQQQDELRVADTEDVAEEDVGGRGGKAVVVAEEQDAQAQAGGQHHADGGVALVLAHAQDADEGGDHGGAAERAGDGVVGHQQARPRRR